MLFYATIVNVILQIAICLPSLWKRSLFCPNPVGKHFQAIDIQYSHTVNGCHCAQIFFFFLHLNFENGDRIVIMTLHHSKRNKTRVLKNMADKTKS